MKTPALPTRISSLFAFLWLLLLIALALLTLFGFLFTSQARGGTLVVGVRNDVYAAPFGVNTKGAYPSSRAYQQIYTSTSFSGPVWISQIGFMSSVDFPAVDQPYLFSLGLGVTALTPAAPGNVLVTGVVPLVSGLFSAHLTAAPDDFDLLIDLPTPFFYDPARGNLLLDFRNISPAAMPNGNLSLDYGFTYDSSQVGYLWDRGTGVDSGQRRGLVTQFTVAPAPEPATAALLCAGVALCLARRRSVERAWR